MRSRAGPKSLSVCCLRAVDKSLPASAWPQAALSTCVRQLGMTKQKDCRLSAKEEASAETFLAKGLSVL